MLGGRLVLDSSPANAALSFRERVFVEVPSHAVRHNVQHRVRKQKVTKATGWPRSCSCCALGCCKEYNDVLVYILRQYWNSLSDGNQREFVDLRRTVNHARVDEATFENPDTDLTGKRINGMILENPTLLASLLDSHASGRIKKLPAPRVGETRPMCMRFFLHILDRSNGWMYPHTVPTSKRFAPSGMRSLQVRHFPTQSTPKLYERGQAKSADVLAWMQQEAQLHLILPNREGTVLPYSTKFTAHAAFVVDFEIANRFEHREASAVLHENRQNQVEEAVEEECMQHVLEQEAQAGGAGPIMQDGLEGMLLQDEEGAERVPRRYVRSKYRYGNPLLGLSSELPMCDGIAGYSLFNKLWRHSAVQRDAHPLAPILRLRKWMPFAKCDECQNRRRQMDAEKDHDALNVLRDAQRGHITFVRQERLSYRLRQRESIWTEECLSLIIDGADQSKHGVPHSCGKSHETDAAWKLKLHLMGVIAHGVGAYVFTCPANVAQGHNVTIQALFDVLEQIKTDKGWIKFPPTLYIQLDNTTKQNKGRWLMAFLALLVEAGTFTKIIVSFLPVGHTHEDIDQFFSRIAMLLRRKDAHSRLALEKLLLSLNCSSSDWGKVRKVTHWENVANISGWLEDKVHAMDSITMWHQFKIMRCNTSGRTLLMAREWPGQVGDYWSGLNKNHTDQPIWKCADVPNLLAEYSTVPNGLLLLAIQLNFLCE